MKAEITISGVLVLSPESETEVFAVAAWMLANTLQVNDLAHDEKTHIKGTAVKVHPSCIAKYAASKNVP